MRKLCESFDREHGIAAEQPTDMRTASADLERRSVDMVRICACLTLTSSQELLLYAVKSNLDLTCLLQLLQLVLTSLMRREASLRGLLRETQLVTDIEHLRDDLMCERPPHEVANQPAAMEDLADRK